MTRVGLQSALIFLFLVSTCYSLEEWNSSEVMHETYINNTAPKTVTPPPWLKMFRPYARPEGQKTHRHWWFDSDGFSHMITYSNYWKWPKYIYYINRWEPVNFDVPLRKWRGGQRAISSWEDEQEKYYYINDTATSPSVFVSRDDQGHDYDLYLRDYRSNWMTNDSMIFKFTNDTPLQIPPEYMERKRRQRGSVFGLWDKHFLVPIKPFWRGLSRNRGRLLHETWS